MLKITKQQDGKLARKSKTMSTKDKVKQQKVHQIQNAGFGSVFGLEDLLVKESKTYDTSLTCLSMKGQLFRIDKDVFYSKIQSQHNFIRMMKKNCCDQMKNQTQGLLNMQKTQTAINDAQVKIKKDAPPPTQTNVNQAPKNTADLKP